MNNKAGDVPQPQGHLLLRGLDGTNPLGFLAAVGAFRLLAVANSDIRMAWQVSDGTWRPTVIGVDMAIADIGSELQVCLGKLDKGVWSIDKKLPFSASRLRQEARGARSSASIRNRERADAVASLGVEFCCDDKGDFDDTAFRMVRAGDSTGQGLLAYGKRILESTTAQQLQRAVMEEWHYDDDQCALRLDPAENRGYALQWLDPSKAGATSVKGGNCLALVAMPMFPTAPVKGAAETMGFGLKESKKSSFTWPIWQPAITISTLQSLLGLTDLQRKQPPVAELASRGIAAVYRCDRIMTSTYYANFTPSQPCT